MKITEVQLLLIVWRRVARSGGEVWPENKKTAVNIKTLRNDTISKSQKASQPAPPKPSLLKAWFTTLKTKHY